jgi:CDP-diacylglycerol pyrophosphatase
VTPVTKVLLGLGLLLVVAVVLVAGAVIYATWFDSRQEVEAHIVPDEDVPNMTKKDVGALADTHFLYRLKLCNTRLAWP